MIGPNNLASLKGRRVIAAMSGGVDSSVMAALLHQAGVEVIGVFMHVWDYSREDIARHGSCCATEDAYDARRVADMLGIDFYNMDMRETFRRDVIDPFISDYESGRTPNPCERCNRFVKFGALLEIADRLEAEYVATGHYVQRCDDETGVHFFKGADAVKDQSYFLATTSRAQAARILFPVGHMEKDETRRIARASGLPTASKHESQDICFIPSGDRMAFLRSEGSQAGFVTGDIVDTGGNILGHHQGVACYTLGQRKGLGLSGGPWHVVMLDSGKAQVVVAHPEQSKIRRADVGGLSWIRPPESGEAIEVKLRYQSKALPCLLTVNDGVAVVAFDVPQAPTAPGQVAAFYSGPELLGGGIVQGVYASA